MSISAISLIASQLNADDAAAKARAAWAIAVSSNSPLALAEDAQLALRPVLPVKPAVKTMSQRFDDFRDRVIQDRQYALITVGGDKDYWERRFPDHQIFQAADNQEHKEWLSLEETPGAVEAYPNGSSLSVVARHYQTPAKAAVKTGVEYSAPVQYYAPQPAYYSPVRSFFRGGFRGGNGCGG